MTVFGPFRPNIVLRVTGGAIAMPPGNGQVQIRTASV